MQAEASIAGQSPERQPWQLEMYQRSLKKRLKLAALVEQISVLPGQACLLVTCGDNTGALNWHLQAAGGDWTWGDVHGDNLEAMSQLLGQPVHKVSAGHLPFADGQFDSVVSIDVLEHLDDDQPFLREMRRVLRPGGRAVVTVPNGDPRLLANRLKLTLGMRPMVYGHTRSGYTLAELQQAIERAGLAAIGRSGYSRFFTELVELLINFTYVFVLARRRGAQSPGSIAPTSAVELKNHGAAYRFYRLLFPLLQAFSRLDALLPASGNYAVIVTAVRPGFERSTK